jgi:hypothetical protein
VSHPLSLVGSALLVEANALALQARFHARAIRRQISARRSPPRTHFATGVEDAVDTGNLVAMAHQPLPNGLRAL